MGKRNKWEEYINSKSALSSRRGVSKYGNVWTTIEHAGKLHRFQSKREAKRARELLLLQQSGEILDLEFQVPILLIAGITYIPDFRYKMKSGEICFEDSKGKQTAVFRLKLRLLKYLYPNINLILS